MIYKVIIHTEAARDAEQAYRYIADRASVNAARWYDRLIDAMFSLREFPTRYPLAPESRYLNAKVRHLVHGNYRILYDVDDRKKIVRILHLRHAARRAIGENASDPEDE